MRVLMVLAAIGLVTLPIHAQDDTKTTDDDSALLALVTTIRELGADDSRWRLDSDVVVRIAATGAETHSRDSTIVANVLERPVRTFRAIDKASGCPISTGGEKLSGCERDGGIQLLSIHRSGSLRTLASFMVYLSDAGPKTTTEFGSSWRVVLERQADGRYRLKRPPMLLLAH